MKPSGYDVARKCFYSARYLKWIFKRACLKSRRSADDDRCERAVQSKGKRPARATFRFDIIAVRGITFNIRRLLKDRSFVRAS